MLWYYSVLNSKLQHSYTICCYNVITKVLFLASPVIETFSTTNSYYTNNIIKWLVQSQQSTYYKNMAATTILTERFTTYLESVTTLWLLLERFTQLCTRDTSTGGRDSLYFIDEVASTDTALDKNQPLGFTTLLCIVASLVVA